MKTAKIMENKEDDEHDDCPICCCKRRIASWITCPSCSFSCCRGCVQKYLISGNNLTPNCMSEKCNKQWDFEFLAENTHADFHNKEYRDFRSKLLLQREKSLLPTTQPLAIEEKNRKDLGSEIQELEEENAMFRQLMYENDRKLKALKTKMKTHVWERLPEEKEEKKEKFKYIAHCPKNDCNGYVGENWRCGLCNQKVCGKCHQTKMSKKEENYVKHVCKNDDVETAKLLAKDTKPCPGCSIPIHKISGCSQMFCTSCNTAFDWNTGKIETGVIHNPHYYAFQRQQNGGIAPRVRGDVRCGGVPDMWGIGQHLQRLNIPQRSYEWLYEARRIVDHILHVELLRYPNELGEGAHLDLRVKYLLKELDEKKWIVELKRREKKREKDRSINLVLGMFANTISDMFTNLLEAKNADQATEIFIGMVSLRDYANQNLQKIGDRFGNKVPQIDSHWKYVGVGINNRRNPNLGNQNRPFPIDLALTYLFP